MGIEIDRDRIDIVVKKSLRAMEGRQGLFSEGVFRPEQQFIENVKDLSERTGKPEFAPNALFLTTAFVFGDDTARLFKRISDPGSLSQSAWIFDPKEALERDAEEIIAGVSGFFRPAGYNKNVVQEWQYNLQILSQKYGGDVRNFFSNYGDDMDRVFRALIVRPRAKTEEKRRKGAFTRYGPKIASLVIQWMDQYDLYRFENPNNGRIPIDFQVARIPIQTGGVVLDQPENAHQVSTAIGKTLAVIANEQGLQTRQISEALWNIGNRGCNQRRHAICPLQEECDRLISRKPYDKDGKFDPQDVGRWE